MATQEDIEAAYDYLDDLIRLFLGEYGEVTCAVFAGDSTKTLEQAQRQKHEAILDALGVVVGSRVLDIGCGWGPLMRTIDDRGGRAVGLTLSRKQRDACVRNGLNVQLQDWKFVDRAALGTFDGIAVVESLEHFCSPAEYLAGQQEAIYRDFFTFCRELLPPGGRLYLQTTVWGKNAPAYQEVSLEAKKGSAGHMLAYLERAFPGTWMPLGMEQLASCARPTFRLVSSVNGRCDYLETMARWDAVWKISPRKLLVGVKILRYALVDPDIHYKILAHFRRYWTQCFVQEIMDHYRMVFVAE